MLSQSGVDVDDSGVLSPRAAQVGEAGSGGVVGGEVVARDVGVEDYER